MEDSIIAKLSFLVLFWNTKIQFIQGGLCWQYRHGNGTCYGLVSSFATEKECCSAGMGVAYSQKLIKDNIFRYLFVTIPACKPCPGACQKVKCEKDKRCVLSADGTATCQCNPDCLQTYQHKVCGSDGRTYSSECTLLRKRCLSDRNLSVEYLGACKAMCKEVKCLNGKVCHKDRHGRSFCVPQTCPKTCAGSTGRQVCGTDKTTYPNLCHLLKSGCSLGRRITIAYLGPCKNANCDNINCPSGKNCVIDSFGLPRCISCQCPLGSQSLPVCGSDGQRHKSWCHMVRKGCQTKRLITIDLSGKC